MSPLSCLSGRAKLRPPIRGGRRGSQTNPCYLNGIHSIGLNWLGYLFIPFRPIQLAPVSSELFNSLQFGLFNSHEKTKPQRSKWIQLTNKCDLATLCVSSNGRDYHLVWVEILAGKPQIGPSNEHGSRELHSSHCFVFFPFVLFISLLVYLITLPVFIPQAKFGVSDSTPKSKPSNGSPQLRLQTVPSEWHFN